MRYRPAPARDCDCSTVLRRRGCQARFFRPPAGRRRAWRHAPLVLVLSTLIALGATGGSGLVVAATPTTVTVVTVGPEMTVRLDEAATTTRPALTALGQDRTLRLLIGVSLIALILGLVAVRHLRTTRRALHAARSDLHESRQNFGNLVQENRSGILMLDADGDVQFANPAAESLMGPRAHGLVGMPFGIPVTSDQPGAAETEISIVRHDGTAGVAAMVATPARWQGRPAYLVMLHDVTERKDQEERMQRLAYSDSLTGLPNRDLFCDRLQQGLILAKREGKGLAVLFMDLDGFKQVNDTLGHGVGDALLRAVADRLRTLPRISDTVARIGGDEFAGIFYDVDNRAGADRVGEKILDGFCTPFHAAGHTLHITPSIGISLFPIMTTKSAVLMQQADSAMYVAKRAGGNGWRLFGHDTPLASQSRLELERELRSALRQDQFVLYYQPKVEFITGRCVGFEALLRWQHPQRGLVDTAGFLPLLDSTGLIIEVGRWVFDEACRQLREWLDQRAEPCTVAVNCSHVQAERGDLFAQVAAAVALHHIAPQLMILELTESAMLAHTHHTLTLLERLASLGVALHLDDFGTGYSALASIKHLPISGIKLDQQFIADLGTDDGHEALVAATLTLAHALGNVVIAEGVETAAQAAILARIGCDLAQGFYFSPPLPAAEVPQWRQSWAERSHSVVPPGWGAFSHDDQ
ncbi:MAG TPA: EAL domain-containing protein [Lamprocystis sp. (in: g-proteobacteria)]|nr:EAL domain-containing protein [Lamprocystis sp. (in: g-proteobacteria)]